MSTDWPPPRVRHELVRTIALLMLAGTFFIVALEVFGSITRRVEGTEALPVTVLVLTGIAGPAVVLTAVALLRRRGWALWLAVAELLTGAGAFFGLMVYLGRNPSGPPDTDGQGYEVLGAAEFGVVLLIFAIALLLPTARRELRAAPPAWYADPSGQARWRYWSGEGWIAHVG